MIKKLEIGLADDHSLFVPPKQLFHSTAIAETGFRARGNCYHSCFEEVPEITLHSILELGSPNVEQMEILKFKNDKLTKPCDDCKRTRFRYD